MSTALDEYLAVPGARTTLPVSACKRGFTAEFAAEARKHFGSFHYQLGGDHALYYNLRLSEFEPTAAAFPVAAPIELESAPDPRVGQVRFTTSEGEMTLDQYVVHPNHRVQALLIAHQGKIAFETYPGMNQSDHHVWMSPAKTTVGLVFAQYAEEGTIDVGGNIAGYLPELKGTSWDGVTVLNLLNMSAGLGLEETLAALVDPASLIVRFFSAEFGQPAPGKTDIENWLDVVKLARPLPGERQGEVMRYSSANTTILNHMAERVENKPWTDIFADRVWSKLGVRGPVLINLTPDGTAVAHGLVATTLRDMARYALQFTPSWNAAAAGQVVSPAVLRRIQEGGDPAAYAKGATFRSHREYFGEDPLKNTYQFDDAFADGALFKHGNVGQGIYVDPGRDVIGVYFSTNGYIKPYGEDKAPGFIRRAAKLLAGG